MLLLVHCFLRPGFLEAEEPGKVGMHIIERVGAVFPPKIDFRLARSP